jgi:hypothetical protein
MGPAERTKPHCSCTHYRATHRLDGSAFSFICQPLTLGQSTHCHSKRWSSASSSLKWVIRPHRYEVRTKATPSSRQWITGLSGLSRPRQEPSRRHPADAVVGPLTLVSTSHTPDVPHLVNRAEEIGIEHVLAIGAVEAFVTCPPEGWSCGSVQPPVADQTRQDGYCIWTSVEEQVKPAGTTRLQT